MKKLIIITILLSLISVLFFSAIGCAKCIDTEYTTVNVEIVDSYYRGARIMPMRVGKVTTYVTHPARYNITVKFNDIEFTINNKNTYEKYHDKIGQLVEGCLEICTYDDGTVKYDIVSIE